MQTHDKNYIRELVRRLVENIFVHGVINSCFHYFLRIELASSSLIEIRKIIVGKVKFTKAILTLQLLF